MLCVMFVASVCGAFVCRSCGTELMRYFSHDVLCVQCAVCLLWSRAFVLCVQCAVCGMWFRAFV